MLQESRVHVEKACLWGRMLCNVTRSTSDLARCRVDHDCDTHVDRHLVITYTAVAAELYAGVGLGI